MKVSGLNRIIVFIFLISCSSADFNRRLSSNVSVVNNRTATESGDAEESENPDQIDEPVSVAGAFLFCNPDVSDDPEKIHLSCHAEDINRQSVEVDFTRDLIRVRQDNDLLMNPGSYEIVANEDSLGWSLFILRGAITGIGFSIEFGDPNKDILSIDFELFLPQPDPIFSLANQVYHPTQPDDFDGNEDCTTIEKIRYQDFRGTFDLLSWNDESCDHDNYRFACQDISNPLNWVLSEETGNIEDFEGKCPEGFWFARPLNRGEDDALVALVDAQVARTNASQANRPQIWLNWKRTSSIVRPTEPLDAPWDFIPGTIPDFRSIEAYDDSAE